MSDFGFRTGSQRATSRGSASLNVTSGNSKSAWVELISSTAFDFNAVGIEARIEGQTSGLVDIGIGAASSETVLIPDIYFASGSGASDIYQQIEVLPFRVPRGVRLSARAATTDGSDVIASLSGLGSGVGDYQGLSRVTAHGIDAANSKGTNLGNGSGTGYIELVASTASRARGFSVRCGVNNVGVANDTQGVIYVAFGAGGSEVDQLYFDYLTRPSMTQDMGASRFPFISLEIPAGTRISVKNSFGGGTPTTICAAVYALD